MILVVALAFAVASPGDGPRLAVGTAPATVAMVPVAGERVTLEEVPLYEKVDSLLRAAAANTDIALQPAEVTRAHLSTLREAGIDCDLADRQCLAKIAVLAEVGRLLVPVARREGSVFHMRILVVDATGKGRELKGDLTVSDDAEADRRLAGALVHAALVATLEDNRPVVAPPPEVPPPEAAPAARPAADLPWLGIGVISASAVVALGGGIGAMLVNESLAAPEPYADRQVKMAIGQACLVGMGAGALGAGFGGLLVALGE